MIHIDFSAASHSALPHNNHLISSSSVYRNLNVSELVLGPKVINIIYTAIICNFMIHIRYLKVFKILGGWSQIGVKRPCKWALGVLFNTWDSLAWIWDLIHVLKVLGGEAKWTLSILIKSVIGAWQSATYVRTCSA